MRIINRIDNQIQSTTPTASVEAMKKNQQMEEFQALLLKEIYLKSILSKEDEDENEKEETLFSTRHDTEANDIMMNELSKQLAQSDILKLKKYEKQKHLSH